MANPAEVTVAVLHGDADIGLTDSRAAEQGIAVAHRQTAPVLAVMRPDHPLAPLRSVTLAQMHPHPIALPDRANTVRQLFDIGCSHRGLVFEPVLTSSSFEALTQYVLHTGCLSISGEIAVRHRIARGELHGVAIRERGMDGRVIELQTLAGRTLPEGVRSFLQFLKQQLPVPAAGDCSTPQLSALRSNAMPFVAFGRFWQWRRYQRPKLHCLCQLGKQRLQSALVLQP